MGEGRADEHQQPRHQHHAGRQQVRPSEGPGRAAGDWEVICKKQRPEV